MSRWHVEQGDALELLRALPDESVDLVITDPPYSSLEKHRKIGTTTRLKQSKASSNKWFPVVSNDYLGDVLAELYRVMCRDSHLYMMCDQETMFYLKPAGERAGFKFWKPLVWDKKRIGMGYHYRARYEFILFFEKGKRQLADLSIADIIECPSIRGEYPTEKPVDLFIPLIRNSSPSGSIVLDPFCGSASVGEAALREDRKFLGFDLVEDACSMAASRLKMVEAQQRMRF